MHAPGISPRDADTWTRSGTVWSEYCHGLGALHGIRALRACNDGRVPYRDPAAGVSTFYALRTSEQYLLFR
eukprot:2346462-Prymnesium_polylepis.1